MFESFQLQSFNYFDMIDIVRYCRLMFARFGEHNTDNIIVETGYKPDLEKYPMRRGGSIVVHHNKGDSGNLHNTINLVYFIYVRSSATRSLLMPTGKCSFFRPEFLYDSRVGNE